MMGFTREPGGADVAVNPNTGVHAVGVLLQGKAGTGVDLTSDGDGLASATVPAGSRLAIHTRNAVWQIGYEAIDEASKAVLELPADSLVVLDVPDDVTTVHLRALDPGSYAPSSGAQAHLSQLR